MALSLSLPLLKVQHIAKRYKNRHILEDIHFDLSEGEMVTIIGPNGCGKTTLIRIIMGLLAPDQGTVWKRPGIQMGYIPQRLVLNPLLPLTVRRFLLLLPSVSVAPELLMAVATEMGIASILDTQIHQVSGGEMQRAMLARALLVNPQVLILDEPMQGVDITGQMEFYRILAHLKNNKKISILMVSHDLHMVMKATDKVICINHHICCAGTPEDVSKHPSYVELFGQEALRTLAIYHHHHDHDHTHDHDETT